MPIRRACAWWADRHCPRAIWRWHLRPLGRRGGLLALLALLWLGAAAQVAVGTSHDPSAAILHERIPAGIRVGLWVATAVVMLAGAFAGRTRPWAQRVGYGAALVMPAERALGYGWSLFMWAVPGPPPGALASLAGLGQWVVVTAIVYVVAGWDEDVIATPHPDDEQGAA